jgi:ribose transport system permease protein
MRKIEIRKFVVWAILGIVLIYFSIASDKFLQVSNLIAIMRHAVFLSIISCGLTFVMITGLIDISIGSAVGIVGLVISLSILKGWNGLVGIFIIPIIASIGISLFNSIVITKLKIPSLIVTLAMLISLRGIKLVMYPGADIVLKKDNLPGLLSFISRDYFLGIPISVYVLVLIIILGVVVLNKTLFGRKVFAVGVNEHVAFLHGIKPDNIKIFVFVILGFCVYISSFILVGRIGGYSTNFGQETEIEAILAVVVGGTNFTGGSGSIMGSIGGVLLVSTILNGLVLMRIPYEWHKVTIGIIFIMIVALDRLINRGTEIDLSV